jgi:hypothetical protein
MDLSTYGAVAHRVAKELWPLAEYLDACEAGVVEMDACRYRTSAQQAKALITAHLRSMQVQELCKNSWALDDILEDLLLAEEQSYSAYPH